MKRNNMIQPGRICVCFTSKLRVVQLELSCPKSLLKPTLHFKVVLLDPCICNHFYNVPPLRQESSLSTLDLILYT